VRRILLAIILATTATAHGANDAPVATGVLNGKRVNFAEKGLAGGVKATIALLESCHDLDDATPVLADLKKAREGDHVRLVFARPVGITVLGKSFKVSELIFTQPSNTGVFWLRGGGKLTRCTKFEPQKSASFIAWLEQARAED
jgi:hypothetical protein